MIAYKCAKCGAGELEPLGDGRKAICQYCFSVMVLPTLDPEAFNRATELRQQLQFDQAEMAFERIVAEYPTDSESYWNLVLCRYGIEYVTDRDNSRVPTCHRMSYQSILEDPDYKKALQYADGYSRERYQEEAAKIDRVLKRIAQISHTQPDYDIFISYKESDDQGHRTADSIIAQNIYDAVKHKHPELNVFLSRITLKELAAGMEYEPVIFSALNTAKVMIVVGTSRENMESVWVRNEWSRYRRMMDQDRTKKMAVVFKDMQPADFPAELNSFAIQAMEAEGFYMQDLVRGIEDLLGIRNKRAQNPGQLYTSASSLQAANLLRRANQELEEGNSQDAKTYFQKALDVQADCTEAWWGLLYVETQGLTLVDPEKTFELSPEAAKAWNMVQKYAEGEEQASYQEQMKDYRLRWEQARVHLETERQIAKLKEETQDGTLFDKYSLWGPESARAAKCMENGDEDQRADLSQFMKKYKANHDKFLELQRLKQSKPLDRIHQNEEYKKLDKEREKQEKRLRSGLKHQNGFFFGDVFFAALALAVAFLFSSYGNVWSDGIRYTAHIVPILVCLAFFIMVVKLVQNRGEKTVKIKGGDWALCALKALLPAVVAYFAVEYGIYLKAKPLVSGLSWNCIFLGLMYLVAIAIVLGAVIVFFTGHWILAVVILVVGIAVSDMLDISVSVIPDQVLYAVLPDVEFGLMALAAATLILSLLLYIRNKSALGACDQMGKAVADTKARLEDYERNQLAPLIAEFKPYVAEKYLQDLQRVDREG